MSGAHTPGTTNNVRVLAKSSALNFALRWNALRIILMRSRLCIAVLAVRQCEGFRIPCFFGSTRRQSLLWPACMVDEVPTDGVDALTANP